MASLSELLRDIAARMPGGRRLKAEYDQSLRQREQLRHQLEDMRARLRTLQSEPELLRRLLPVRHAAVAAGGDAVARHREHAFIERSASYREAISHVGARHPPSHPDASAGQAASPLRTKTIDGMSWCVPANDADGRFAADELALPLEEIAHARRLAVGPVMLDLGANIGTTSIPRVMLGDFACVYAAEPDPANYACLVRNVVDLAVRGLVLPDRVAIGNRDGEIALQQGHSGTHHLVAGAVPEHKQATGVRCLRLDTWVDELGIDLDQVRFVKSDTQGWEAHVLEGAPRVLAKKHIAWQVEFSASMLRRAGSSAGEMRALLRAHFSHFIDTRDDEGPRSRPMSELDEALAYIDAGRRSYTNLLLYNV